MQLVSCACTYVPYYVDKDGRCLSNDGARGDVLAATPLEKRLKLVLRDMHLAARYSC